MIFVVVGNKTEPFDRLLQAVEHLMLSGFLNCDEVVVQTGSSKTFQAACRRRDFFPPEEFRHFIEKADVVVCHGGAGTLYHAFAAGKRPVVMPRRRKNGEALDDQLEFVKAVANEGRLIPVFEPEDLREAILKVRHSSAATQINPNNDACVLVARAISEVTANVHPRN